MADQYINATGLQAIKTWITSLFATKSELDTVDNKIETIIAEGGEPNVIEAVKVNGTALEISDKAVDVNVPTTVAELTDADSYALAEDVPTSLAELENSGDDPYATQSYVAENGGKIDTIKVNGAEQTISTKAVNITVPTTVAELSDAANYALASDVETAISSSLTSVYRYKGSVETKTALPSDAESGDVYDVQSNGVNYAWNGESWDALGGEFDATLLWSKSELVAMTVSEINAILEA